MKHWTKHLVLGLAVALIVTACGKMPTKTIDEVKAVIDEVTIAGADKYAANDLKMLNDSLVWMWTLTPPRLFGESMTPLSSRRLSSLRASNRDIALPFPA